MNPIQMNPEMVANYRASEQAIIMDRSFWATAGFAVSVFGGALGGLFLLLRNAIAFWVFVASLIGTALTMIHTGLVAASVGTFSGMELFVMLALPLIVAGALTWYARFATQRSWIV